MSFRSRHFFLGLAAVVLVGSLLGCDTLIPWLDGEDQQTLQRCTPVASTNGPVGEWEHLGLSGEEIGQIRAVAVNPCDPRVIYAGAGADFSAGIRGRIFKSTDGGASWKALLGGSTGGGGVLEIEIDPYRPDTVYALAGTGVLKTTDGGKTWQITTGGRFRNLDRRPTALVIDPKNPGTLYLGTVSSGLAGSVLKSTNGGKSWYEVGEDDDAPRGGITGLAIDPENTEVVYAAGEGIFKSTNGGEIWKLVRRTGGFIYDLSVAFGERGRVYAALGDEGVIRSENGGNDWNPFNEGLSEEGFAHGLEKGGGELFLAYNHKDGAQLYRREMGVDAWTSSGIDSLAGQPNISAPLEFVTPDSSLLYGLEGLYRIRLASTR